MSLVQLRVELPTYAHSFVIHVPSSCSIIDVKHEISRACIGEPRVDGQRLIWRGRYLVDHEKVDELWKSLDEPRIVHLAVHPSAWSSAPPDIPQPAQSSFPNPTVPRQTQQADPAGPEVMNFTQPALVPPTTHPLAYVVLKHQNALLALTGGSIAHTNHDDGLAASRSSAIMVVERHGWSWPAILDEEFPAAIDGGLKYEVVTIDGQSFLSLCSPSATPTALQTHALKVLTYTFTLLSIPVSQTNATRTAPSQTVPIPPNVNLLLQQLGLPQLRVAQNQNPNPNPNPILPELREMPLRPLLAPLMMLVFRTLLLLYFVAPARKPIFGILILAWMLYEIWRPIRDGLVRGWRRAAPDNQPRQNAPPGEAQNPIQNAAPEGQRPLQNGPGGAAAQRLDNQMAAIIDTLGNMNVNSEEQILNDTPGAVTIEPSLGHKFLTFVGLLLTTIHPAVWNRRRVALRQREGRIRTEANMRDEAPNTGAEGEEPQNENRAQMRAELRAQHARRPRWVRNYMERVVTGDWVDDAD